MSCRVILPQLINIKSALNGILGPYFLAYFMFDEIITLYV